MIRVAKIAKEADFEEVLAWNDMFDDSSVNEMKLMRLGWFSVY